MRKISEVDDQLNNTISFLRAKTGYLKKGSRVLALHLGIEEKVAKNALKQVKNELKERSVTASSSNIKNWDKRPFKEGFDTRYYNSFKKQYNIDNVLFIADLHCPWMLDGYIEWCKEQQEKYNCGMVIFSGDILDSGAWSYHEHDPDGYGVKDELYAAKKQLNKVFSLFPEAICLLGNHDLLISRKAKTAGLSQEFIKDFGSVIGAPKGWKFVHEYTKDNVHYIHGSIGNAFRRAVLSRQSTCQGHLHSETFVQWSVSEKDAIFGLQVGAGFDRDKYSFDYAKPFPKKPVISCGVILEKGKIPLTLLMPL